MKRLIYLASCLLPFFSSASFAQEGSSVPLHGRVHTLLTEQFQYSNGASGDLSVTLSYYQVFDASGREVEITYRKPNGLIELHLTREYDEEGRLLREVCTSDEPNRSFSTQNFYDSQGQMVESVDYDGSGRVISRIRHETDSGGATTSFIGLYPRDGGATRLVSSESQDPDNGETVRTLNKNGTLESETRLQRDAGGHLLHSEFTASDGSSTQVDFRADGAQIESAYSASDKTHTYKTTDSRGRVVASAKESASSRTHREYRYDETGRMMEIAEYDTSAKLIAKETTEYLDDSAQNWIEQKWTRWDAKAEPIRPDWILIRRRAIEYY